MECNHRFKRVNMLVGGGRCMYDEGYYADMMKCSVCGKTLTFDEYRMWKMQRKIKRLEKALNKVLS